MRKNQYPEIVAQATAYIKANLERPISIPEIVKHTGFSIVHVRNAFRKILNQSILECLQDERIGKAKMLLQKTQLDITQVAFDSGFENYVGFYRVFRQSTGMTPSLFRKKVTQLRELPVYEKDLASSEKKEEWFKDHFRTKKMESHWKLSEGEWDQNNGTLNGKGPYNSLFFQRPLPENCRIRFGAMVETDLHLDSPSIFVWLLDELRRKSYCQFSIAAGNRTIGHLVHHRFGLQWNPSARMTAGEWHTVVLEIREERLLLCIDGKDVFSLRDPFPPAYASRCYLALGSYHCPARFREFSIQNLGFMSMMPPIRQGDALYNTDLHEKAMEFYLRYLNAGQVSDEETMELRYKIGICCLRLNAFSQAKNWIGKVVNLREEPFWCEQARLAFLEICWRTADLEEFQEQMANCLRDEKIRGSARVTIQNAAADFNQRGFFGEAIRILTGWSGLEIRGDYAYQMAQLLMSEGLLKMHRTSEASAVLEKLARSTPFDETVPFIRIDLMQLNHEKGDIAASESLREEIEISTRDPFLLVRCRIQQALNLRAQERLEDALAMLEEIPHRFSTVESAFHSHAKIHSALILCCMGRLEEGRKTLEEARTVDPSRHLNTGHYLPFYLSEKNYLAAAESLLKDFRNSRELVSSSAELGVKAGILHELAGLLEEAKSIFKGVSQRFANEQVRFFGPLAHALFSGEEFDVATMPYEHFRRSELFYLLGLLKEKHCDKIAAKVLFKLSVKDDPALRWPAYFAGQKTKPGV